MPRTWAPAATIPAAPNAAIADAFLDRGEAPANRVATGMTATATDTSGKYVESVDVVDGVLVVEFGHEANQAIHGLTVTLTPYETAELGVVWSCGAAPAPVGLDPMGTASGGVAADPADPATTVPLHYLPTTCRP
jgi:hypothetical protein